MNELIRLCRKAANEWRNTDTYHQASVLIDSLCDRLEKYEPRKPKTNADRIRSMSDEELADFIQHVRTNTLLGEALGVSATRDEDLEFLRKPAKDGENE